jgi:hypothetical protein
MSEAPRIALVAEGKTDRIIIESAIRAILGERPFTLRLLQPEDPLSTPAFGVRTPGGWGGVYRWCRETSNRSNSVVDDVLFLSYDMLIIHLDADVAESTYASAHVTDAADPDNLPCVQPCPPPSATTDRLRSVLMSWGNIINLPSRVVLCTPCKNTETWIVTALYPTEPVVANRTVECREEPEAILRGKPAAERLISGDKKSIAKYEEKQNEIGSKWDFIKSLCTEARRFDSDFRIAAAAN